MLILVPTALEARRLFPEIAVPGPGGAVRWMSRTSLSQPAYVACCGFGLASAGARAAAAWQGLQGDAVLAGVAGTYDARRLPPGELLLAASVEVDGIGFGEGEAFRAPDAAPGPMADEWARLAPADAWTPPLRGTRAPLLSVASASEGRGHAESRLRRHPACLAEDMEAHAVLHAASALGRRAAILRGISNVAGDREPSRWRLDAALHAVREALDEWLRP